MIKPVPKREDHAPYHAMPEFTQGTLDYENGKLRN
jgi:hypothetical protein